MTHTNKVKAFGVACLLVVGTMLPGCDEFQEFDQYRGRRDSISPYLGDSVRHNAAVQTIDPFPAHAQDNRIGLDGHRAELAAKRYRENKVIPPRGLSSTDSGSGSNANSGTGGNSGGTAK